MPGVFVGETKALVFPVMCDGYLKMNYADKNSSTNTHLDLRQGIWGHDSSFTIEAIITPYDVNGFGSTGSSSRGVTTSEKTPPSVNVDETSANKLKHQSEDYFTTTRQTHKMMLFHSDGFELYLQNTTVNNFNQPAEYKLCAKVGSQNPIETGTIISTKNSLYGYYDSTAVYDGATTSLRFLDAAILDSGNIIDLTTASNVNKVAVGTELFDNTGTSIGKVTVVDSDDGKLTLDTAQSSRNVYYSQPKEAIYLESMFKITCCLDINGRIKLYLNNNLVLDSKVTVSNFNFGTTDCYIGQDPDTNNTQFMGEIYEIAMYKRKEPSVNTTTLNIGYNDIIFYYRFGDE
tara:strand:+ start:5373 stop:6410 length:1038 start_codon:yes stop_codon:yes gene_type:complete